MAEAQEGRDAFKEKRTPDFDQFLNSHKPMTWLNKQYKTSRSSCFYFQDES